MFPLVLIKLNLIKLNQIKLNSKCCQHVRPQARSYGGKPQPLRGRSGPGRFLLKLDQVKVYQYSIRVKTLIKNPDRSLSFEIEIRSSASTLSEITSSEITSSEIRSSEITSTNVETQKNN